MTNETRVFQFKVTLQDVKPAVWRRIQTPSLYSFWDLHVAIQDAMGWRDVHLHEFHMIDPAKGEMTSIGIPDDEDFGDVHDVIHGRECSTSDYWSAANPSARYVYDFGDDWNHEIVLEEVLEGKQLARPVCLDGKGACPPEDCGGPFGYAEFLRAIKKPGSPRGSELLEWVGGAFDPNHFQLDGVAFDDPEARWLWTFNDSIDLENGLHAMMENLRKSDRQGRIAYQLPHRLYAMILKHPADMDITLLERLGKASQKDGMVSVKFDTDELRAFGVYLSTVAKKCRPGLDRQIFLALRQHFTAMESLARGL